MSSPSHLSAFVHRAVRGRQARRVGDHGQDLPSDHLEHCLVHHIALREALHRQPRSQSGLASPLLAAASLQGPKAGASPPSFATMLSAWP